jgi:hypothetical protein
MNQIVYKQLQLNSDKINLSLVRSLNESSLNEI